MKKTLSFLFLSLFVSLTNTYGQCEPDTTDCKNEDGLGAFCPRQLPVATVNKEYEAVITAIPPGEVTIPQGTFLIDHIVVDSVKNFPPGISYESNAEKYYADSAYCIRVFGTPTVADAYPLEIYITAHVNLGGNLIPYPVENDTSVIMLVQYASDIDLSRAYEFKILPNVPNPFLETTRISFYTPFDQRVELRVYNILGEMLHEESNGYSPGEHSFEYDGSGLQPGTYIYRVSNQKELFTGKFIKARR